MTAKPLISIVTPTLNQVQTLRECMRSVLEQEGVGSLFDLQYIVVDGGSDDGSLEIIESFRERLHWFRSGADDGPYDAVNRGFDHASGHVMGWLNGDDVLCPWALRTIASVFESVPDCRWLTSRRPIAMDSTGQIASVHCRPGFAAAAILAGAHHPASREALPYIQQESTFFTRELWEQVDRKIETSFSLAGDFDLWLRMAEHAPLDSVPVPLGMFRCVAGQRSSQTEAYEAECTKSLRERQGIVLHPNASPRQASFLQRFRRRILKQPLWSYECQVLERDNLETTQAGWKRKARIMTEADWS
ncbi:MAG: glycosyltransferase [Planctomycetota bacterium]